VAPVISVQGGKEPKDGGGIYYVDVLVRKASLLEDWFPGIRTGATILPPEQFIPPGLTEQERTQEALRQMSLSQETAGAVALRALGYRVVARPSGVLIAAVGPHTPAAGKLEPTEVIVGLDGRPVRTLTDLRRLMARHRPGDTVRLRVRSPDGIQTVELVTIPDRNDPTHALIGILPAQATQVTLPLRIRIDTGDVGGPSAGLALALGLMEELGRDVDHGYKVAATGELSLDGTVSAIGGVKQKTIGARESGVDVLLVPAGDNAREAKRYADGLRIIPVNNFRQALRDLATLAPKD
jgi:PDZ domain-containing protein